MKRKLILSALGLLLLAVSPAGSQAQTSTNEQLKPVIVEVKPPFKERHPRVYKIFRKTRHVCVLVAPIVNVAANCATAAGVFLR